MAQDQQVELLIGRKAAVLDPAGELEQPAQAVLLAERQQVLLVLEVVVEVARPHPGLGRDLAHAGALQAAAPEDARRRLQDLPLLLERPTTRPAPGRLLPLGRLRLNHCSRGPQP